MLEHIVFIFLDTAHANIFFLLHDGIAVYAAKKFDTVSHFAVILSSGLGTILGYIIGYLTGYCCYRIALNWSVSRTRILRLNDILKKYKLLFYFAIFLPWTGKGAVAILGASNRKEYISIAISIIIKILWYNKLYA
jgi:membrane protein YqaA with SNARE-associated domain